MRNMLNAYIPEGADIRQRVILKRRDASNDWNEPGKYDRATTAKKQAAPDLALQHFDFFYGPVFKKQWPSIRLGLLSDSKYCALVNNFSSFDKTVARLASLGAYDLVTHYLETKRKTEEKLWLHGDSKYTSKELPGDTFDGFNTESDLLDSDNDSGLPASRDTSGLFSWVPLEEPRPPPTTDPDPDPDLFLPQATKVGARPPSRESIYWAAKQEEILGDAVSVVEPDDAVHIPDNLKLMAFPRGDVTVFPQAPPDHLAVVSFYLMDAASLFPVLALDVQYGDVVLDLCAAPGGKSLIMLQSLLPGGLVCNDVSFERVNRMRNMLNAYIPEGADIRQRVILKRRDASNDWNEPGKYDRVLVDAPCSNDRHSLLNDEKGNMFRRSNTKERMELPQLQTNILVNGLKSLRRGGTLVYATCTLSPIQNDGVVESALKRLKAEPNEKNEFEFVIKDLSKLAADFRRAGIYRFSQSSKYGQLIVPYIASNFGPLYVCKIKRLET